MRRHYLSAGVIAALGSILVAAPCGGGTGPAARTFAAGALVIPMDNCYQARDTSTPNQSSPACNATRDDGIFRAYGVVYFLLKHGITVYWAIDGATPKTSVTGVDVTVPSGPINKFNWASGTTSAWVTSAITYIGGPFIIDVADKATVMGLLSSSAANSDFAQFKANGWVDVHEVMTQFTAAQVRPLVGPPPKVAILYSYSANTSAGVMVGYAQAAGFNWTCHGACATSAECKAGGACVASVCQDCAGGISTRDATCTQTYVQNQFGITVNNGPGTVYDILCDKDFLPDYTVTPPDFSKATLLATTSPGPYKLLWAPHWETPKTSGSNGTQADPNAAIGTFPRTLADWLQCLASFVGAGNNIFAECHAVVTLEGGAGISGTEYGLPVTRFQSTAGFVATNQTPGPSPTPPWPPPTRFSQPQHPNVQIGDFVYNDVTGSIEYFYPDRSTTTPASTYRSGVQRLMSQDNSGAACGGGCTAPQICVGGTCTLPVDIGTTIPVGTTGNVAYLGGHNYAGQTAGTRIVLNTLFNLGFGCADPNTPCNTGKLGICAAGHLKCAPSGGFQCVQDNQPIPEICGNGLDDDCDGVVDNGCTPTVCNPGQTRPCFAGASGCTSTATTFTCLGKANGCVDNHNGTFTCNSTPPAICRLGTETCSASGAWGACTGEVHPAPQVCNGKDNACNGSVGVGLLCYPGYSCVNGVCLPDLCGVEVNVCPVGFTCDASAKCQPIPCPPGPPPGPVCTAPGQVCIGTTCQDPCQGVTCGPGASCQGGACTGGACYSFGCPAGQICTGGQCIADPCAGSSCPTGTFCRAGDCVRSCVYVKCGAGQVCNRDGFCETPACSPPCVAGQVCSNGACVPDPACKNVPCGAGQVCRAGNCGDAPCANIHCPVGTCVEDQCQGELPPGQAPPTGGKKSGCGCGSAGGAEVLSLGVAALALGARRRRRSPGAPPAPEPGRRSRPEAPGRRWLLGIAALIAAVGVSGCHCGSETCRAGQTKCGGSCVNLDTSASNCGVCGNVCPSQWSCSGGSCGFPTGNPFLKSLCVNPAPSSPCSANAGVGGSVAIAFAGADFQAGMTARFRGSGLDTELPVTVTDASNAQVPALDLTKAAPGTVEVRLLNPGRLVSNPQTLTLLADARLVSVDKPSITQDAAATTLALTGDKFASGMAASLTLVKKWDGTAVTGATPQPLNPTTVVDAQHATAAIAPGSLAIGTYDLKVQNPSGNPSNALALSIATGTPTLSTLSTNCVLPNSVLNATASGTYLYPTTAVDVRCTVAASGCGTFNSVVVQSPTCTTNALAQCANGQISVSQDLAGVPAGNYCVRAMNSGPLFSGYMPFCIDAACPRTCNHTCP